jgi:hypothetical protein
MRSRRSSGDTDRCGSTRGKDPAERVASGWGSVAGITDRAAALAAGAAGASLLGSASGAVSRAARELSRVLAASASAAGRGESTIAYEPDIAGPAAVLASFGIFGGFVAVAAPGCGRASTRRVAARRRGATVDLVTVPAVATSGHAGVDRARDREAARCGRSGVARRRSSAAWKIVNASRRRSDSGAAGGVPEPERLERRIVRIMFEAARAATLRPRASEACLRSSFPTVARRSCSRYRARRHR